MQPQIFHALRDRVYVDEFYGWTVIRFQAWSARAADWLDRWVWNGAVQAVSYLIIGASWVNRFADTYVVNAGFDEGCRRVSWGGRLFSRLQSGQAQSYLRVLGIAFVILVLFLLWGSRG